MNTTTSSNPNIIFGHPKGLFYLFFAELWERFSFYGMRALLVLYMTKQLLFEDTMAFGVYAAYSSLVYVTPLIGGILADKILGFSKAITIGGILMALGHFFLTFEQPVFFYGSLGLIIVGNGFFKPNISSLVGELYQNDNEKRDAGFTVFYLGINVGAAIAPLLCAWIAELYGWHYGFVLAGIGMLVGLLVFKKGLKKDAFNGKGEAPQPIKKTKKGITQEHKIILGAILSVPLFALIIKFNQFEHYLVWLVSIFIIGFIIYILKTVSINERKRLFVAVYFTVLYVLFSAIFEQAGSSLTLFADRNVNLIGLNAAGTNSINAGFIMLLAIPFSILWTYLTKKGKNPNSPIKFGIGMILLGLGFVIFATSASSADTFARTSMFYLVVGYFVLTVGELFLSPIGLSKMTELSPAKYLAFIMGVWLSANFYGHFFAGKIAILTASKEGGSIFTEGGFTKIIESITGLNNEIVSNGTEALQQLFSYVSIYVSFGIISIIVGIIALLISPFIKKLMIDIK